MSEVSINSDKRPPSKDVTDFHTNSDVDAHKEAQHHTIGTGVNQAASGAHNHRGGDSVRLGVGLKITGAKGGNTALSSVIAAMVEILGVEDQTTA